MHYLFNTGPYRKLYKSFIKRYDECDKIETIEPRVRSLSKVIRESGLGVSIWSCEGHSDEDYPNRGYVMLAARNQEAALKLLSVFQECSRQIVNLLGWEALPEIETPLAFINEDDSYPCIIIRNPDMHSSDQLDIWWDIVTRCAQHQLKHYS